MGADQTTITSCAYSWYCVSERGKSASWGLDKGRPRRKWGRSPDPSENRPHAGLESHMSFIWTAQGGYRRVRYRDEADFEAAVLQVQADLFGPDRVYLDIKKRIGVRG